MKLIIGLLAMGVLFVARMWYLAIALFFGVILYVVAVGVIRTVVENLQTIGG